MIRDPFIRSYAETPPLFFGPGCLPGASIVNRHAGIATREYVRFRWPELGDEDVLTIRREVQDGGPGLFVLRDPFDEAVKYLVEAQYPEKITARYASGALDPARLHDLGFGRLVVIGNDLAPGRKPLAWRGTLHPMVLTSIRAGNRRVRSDLKRQGAAVYHKQDLQSLHDQEGTEIIDRWSDQYAEAFADTVQMMKPHVFT